MVHHCHNDSIKPLTCSYRHASTFFVRLMILALLFASPLAATKHLSLHQRNSLRQPATTRPDLAFRFDAPAGPQFTDAQKQEQPEVRGE